MKAQKTTQYERVRNRMWANATYWGEPIWTTLWDLKSDIKAHFGVMDSEAAISARLRDLRKNGYTVEKRKRKGSRAWEYRLVV